MSTGGLRVDGQAGDDVVRATVERVDRDPAWS
jgi:hypothetical protein